MAQQLGFADAFLADKAGQNRRLARIGELIDWPALEALLPGTAAVAGPGRPAYRPLAMFRALLLAQWYQLSDPGLEEALADRISFRRFCGFALDDMTPDETTFCRFRLSLAEAGRAEALAGELERQLGRRGFLVKEGTMIDATLIEAHVARPPPQALTVASQTLLPLFRRSRIEAWSIRTPASPRKAAEPIMATRPMSPSTSAPG